ncbi:MAG: lipopolysaccharide biosynthesis protein [Undibacterium sp.]|nr:lipopolysaccharide biosynthesis protein [Undibacterium sp.]
MSEKSPSSIFKGALLTISMRWTDRLIGFVSTLILARLLVPADFGVIAVASLIVGLVDVLLDLGVNVALIQNRHATDAHFNTAWTLRLIQTVVGALIIYIAAPYAAVYFKDPRVTPVLQVMAIGLILVGMENIGVITFQKEMKFSLDFRFTFCKRISGFIVTMLAAWLLRSYWALVIGALAGRSIGVLLSYQMHPMRPRLTLQKQKEIFSISQWMLLQSLGNYLNHNLHSMLVGRRASATVMGGYTLAGEISAMPSTEVLAPLNRVLFPAFVKNKDQPVELKKIFLLAQSVQCLLGIPAGIGIALIAPEAVQVILGEAWLFAIPFLQILALVHVTEAITTSSGYLLISIGKLRDAVVITWMQVLFFVLAITMIFAESSVKQIAWLRVATVFIGLFLSFWRLTRTLNNLSLLDLFRSIFRPLFAVLVMAAVIFSIGNLFVLSAITGLILKIVLGLLIYPSVVMLIWWLSGRPAGAETYILEKVLFILKRTSR